MKFITGVYFILLVLHSIFRWVVLASLVLGICKAYSGFSKERPFSKVDNAVRHWTATIAHIQLMLGIVLYIKSPVTHYFWSNTSDAVKNNDSVFFGLYHIALMFLSVVFVTIGSAMAKRRLTDQEKFKTMLIWFSVTLLIILIAIPWPFSPLANRPLIRNF